MVFVDLDFQCNTCMLYSYLCSKFIELWWEVIVGFVDIGGIDDHHCLNFLFNNQKNLKSNYKFLSSPVITINETHRSIITTTSLFATYIKGLSLCVGNTVIYTIFCKQEKTMITDIEQKSTTEYNKNVTCVLWSKTLFNRIQIICLDRTYLIEQKPDKCWFSLSNKGAQLQILFNIILGKIDLYNTGLQHNIWITMTSINSSHLNGNEII